MLPQRVPRTKGNRRGIEAGRFARNTLEPNWTAVGVEGSKGVVDDLGFCQKVSPPTSLKAAVNCSVKPPLLPEDDCRPGASILTGLESLGVSRGREEEQRIQPGITDGDWSWEEGEVG